MVGEVLCGGLRDGRLENLGGKVARGSGAQKEVGKVLTSFFYHSTVLWGNKQGSQTRGNLSPWAGQGKGRRCGEDSSGLPAAWEKAFPAMQLFLRVGRTISLNSLICKCNSFFCGSPTPLNSLLGRQLERGSRQLEAGRIDSHICFLGWCCLKLSGLL